MAKTAPETERLDRLGPLPMNGTDTVLEVQRAVVLVHGFVHVAVGLVTIAQIGPVGAALAVQFRIVLGLILTGLGGYELYVSAQTDARLWAVVRAMVGIYAIAALVALVAVAVPRWSLSPYDPLAFSFLTVGLAFAGLPEVGIALQSLLAASAVVLALSVGRWTLAASSPAWLVPWALGHGIRAVVGAAYYIVCDLGADPLRRFIRSLPAYQRLFITGGGPVRVLIGGLGGPALAVLGGIIAYGLVCYGLSYAPPILHPLIYLVAVDLVLLPLLPGAAEVVLVLYGEVASGGEAWIFVASPIFLALAPAAALILLWLSLHRWLLRAALAVGRWQLATSRRALQCVAGAVWIHLVAWLFVTALNAQTGLMLLGEEAPGASLYKRHLRTPITKLPPEMQAHKQRLMAELLDMFRNQQANEAAYQYTLLAGDHPDADQTRFGDLSAWAQRKLTGMAWYYSPAEFAEDRVERCIVFWGCLLLAFMTMIRWPGLNTILPYVWLRCVVFVIRLAAPTVLLAECLLGTSGRPDMIALNAGLVLVGVAVLALAYWLGWVALRDVGATRHYAPFMATRLLQKRRIAFFAIGAVTLCVAMVLIVISVMGGFLDLVRDRSRGLLGDLIMENKSLNGFPGYQEFIDRIKGLRDENGQPIVAEATPVIYTYGVLRFPVSKVTNMVRVMAIRLDEVVHVTRFGQSLNYEQCYPGTTKLGRQQQPYWGRDITRLPLLPEAYEEARAQGLAKMTDPQERALYDREPGGDYPGPGEYAQYGGSDASHVYDELRTIRIELQFIGEDAAAGNWSGIPRTDPASDGDDIAATTPPATPGAQTSTAPGQTPSTSQPTLADRLIKQAERLEGLIKHLPDWPETQPMRAIFEVLVSQMMDASDKLSAKNKSVVDDLNRIMDQMQDPIDTLARIRTRPGYSGGLYYGVIIGRDLVARRQASGKYERYYPRGIEMTVAVLPLTPGGAFSRKQPISLPLRYVDDSRTGVYDIDSVCVYVEFEMLQEIMEMGPLRRTDGTGSTPPRASQVLIKLTEGQDVLARRAQLVREWNDFCLTWSEEGSDKMRLVVFNTWEEQQAQFIAAVQKEKILVLTLFAVISAVAIFLVLCIFYMIVTEKTRDIGILKSVGASSGGVAGVFLAYGAAIGVVGASLGLWIGTVFVHNINSIQNWIARIHPGLRIWSAEVYTFDIIPDTVKFEEAAVIFVVAILSSVLGATFPALRAGRTWPVEALRYE
ncbi:MAG: FtsX-like permease family protein [Phycisphaerae bacterium]|nr:FtsX-like permease family protein [Phycisphaerae bacterium]